MKQSCAGDVLSCRCHWPGCSLLPAQSCWKIAPKHPADSPRGISSGRLVNPGFWSHKSLCISCCFGHFLHSRSNPMGGQSVNPESSCTSSHGQWNRRGALAPTGTWLQLVANLGGLQEGSGMWQTSSLGVGRGLEDSARCCSTPSLCLVSPVAVLLQENC